MDIGMVEQINSCIHDGHRSYTCKPLKRYFTRTEMRCSECGSLLLIKVHNLLSGEIKTEIVCEIYERYYTRKGRLRWLVKLLQEREIPVPGCWLRDLPKKGDA